jgi:hypothetical protein
MTKECRSLNDEKQARQGGSTFGIGASFVIRVFGFRHFIFDRDL